MKKYFLLGLIFAIAPNICFGAGARYTQLVREKQRKMEELEKCMGSSKGLKIAGLSTIGLTAVGVAGNIAEAQKLQEYDDAIAKKNKDIEAKEKAIVAENEKIKQIEVEKKTEEKAEKEEKKDKDNGNNNIEYNAEEKCYMTLGTWDDQYGDCFCPGLSIWDDSEGCIESEYEEIDLSDVSITSSNINNNNDLSTDKSGTSASGQGNGSATKPTTNVSQETKKFKCKDSGGNWIGGKCQCMEGFNVDYEGKCFRLLDGISITAPRKSDDNNPNMLKNVVERDIAAINATTAKLGAKIYVSGYSSLDLPDGDLFNRLRDAYTDFNDRCSALGEEYSSRPIDARATNINNTLDLNTILTDTTQYALSECWCFTEDGYEKQGDKCVKK